MSPEQYLLNQNPMIATPCYGGLINEAYLRGMTSLASKSASIGMQINMATVVNESLVTRARNELVKHFLQTDSTHLFFIDADIEFSAEDVYALLLHDKEVVVGAYPLKKIRWEGLTTVDVSDVEQAKGAVADYVINMKFKDKESEKAGKMDVVDGLIEVHDAGTGFMCIKRSVIEKMIESYPQTRYVKEGKYPDKSKDDGVRWALFDTMIEPDSERYLSEDYTFCRRWQSIGGKIWLDPHVTLSHIGTYKFEGRTFFSFE